MNNEVCDLNTMSWFVVSAIILGLWKYDRFLLDKFERWGWKKLTSVGWFALQIYSRYKDQNEMIKDGYHVDTVYLYEHRSPTDCVRFDVLSVFRKEINKGTFTHKKSIDTVEFIKICSDSAGNFKFNKDLDYELEVNYTFDRKQYKIIYATDKNNHIKFPVYSESEMAKADIDNGIISAQIIRDDPDKGGLDVDDVLLKFAGPKGNFYSDTDFVVKKSWLKFADVDEQSKIQIMDLEGNEYVFEGDDEYLSLKEDQ